MLLFLVNSVLGATLPGGQQVLPLRKDVASVTENSSVLKNHTSYSYATTIERTLDKCGDDGVRYHENQSIENTF